MSINFNEVKKELLKNPEFKKEYEEFCNNREKENSLTEWREREEWSTNKDQWM